MCLTSKNMYMYLYSLNVEDAALFPDSCFCCLNVQN